MRLVAHNPRLDSLQTLCTHADKAPLLFNFALDQPGALQHLQVSRDCGQADAESSRNVSDAELTRAEQAFDDGPPCWVGERPKDVVELLHSPSYLTALLINNFI